MNTPNNPQNLPLSTSAPKNYDFLNLESSQWQLSKEKKGIKVFTLNIDGLAYKAYRAETILEGGISPFMAVIQDLNNYHTWMHTNTESKLIERISDRELHAYMVHHQRNAFGIKPRDYYAKITIKKNPEDLSVSITWEPLEMPVKEGRVRVNFFKTITHLIPLPDSKKFKLMISGYSDPGGKIPLFLVNFFTKELPYKNLLEFEKIANQPKYKKKIVSLFND